VVTDQTLVREVHVQQGQVERPFGEDVPRARQVVRHDGVVAALREVPCDVRASDFVILHQQDV
jgi:hypothetical protein